MFRVIWLIMLLSGILLLVLSIILFFAWRVLDLMDELSGRKAKRQIKRLHELNVDTGSLERLSTTDVYATLTNGSGLLAESNSINAVSNGTSKKDDYSSDAFEEDDIATCDMDSEKTGYISDSGLDGVTSFFEEASSVIGSKKSISIIEEQSSLD